MPFWIYVTMMLTLPRLLYRLLHEGKPYSELPGNYHYTCRFLDSLMVLGFFALQALSEFHAKWKASIFGSSPICCWHG